MGRKSGLRTTTSRGQVTVRRARLEVQLISASTGCQRCTKNDGCGGARDKSEESSVGVYSNRLVT